MLRFLFITIFVLLYQTDSITVISYNIRYNNPEDGRNIWENRRGTVAALLNEQNMDFVGLQEVVYPQLKDLVQALETYDYIGVGREDGKTKGEYAPIFYKKDKYKLLKSNTFWLSETPDSISKGWDASLERICTYGLFQNQMTQEKIWVFNTHFDHKGIEARIKSVDLIIERIKMLNSDNLPVVITGDFNLTPEAAPIKKMQSHYLDVQKNLPENDPYYATANNFNTEKKGGNRIDYVFVKGLKVHSAKHLYQKTPIGGWASDHHPVFVKLQ